MQNIIITKETTVPNDLPEKVAYDIETTDKYKDRFRLLEIAFIFFNEEYKATHCFHTLLSLTKKEFYQNPDAIRTHKITYEMLKDAPPFPAIAHVIYNLIHDKILYTHNEQFNYDCIRLEFNIANLPVPIPKKSINLKEEAKKRLNLPNKTNIYLTDIACRLDCLHLPKFRAKPDALCILEIIEKLKL